MVFRINSSGPINHWHVSFEFSISNSSKSQLRDFLSKSPDLANRAKDINFFWYNNLIESRIHKTFSSAALGLRHDHRRKDKTRVTGTFGCIFRGCRGTFRTPSVGKDTSSRGSWRNRLELIRKSKCKTAGSRNPAILFLSPSDAL